MSTYILICSRTSRQWRATVDWGEFWSLGVAWIDHPLPAIDIRYANCISHGRCQVSDRSDKCNAGSSSSGEDKASETEEAKHVGLWEGE
jgi:hypothetical protein